MVDQRDAGSTALRKKFSDAGTARAPARSGCRRAAEFPRGGTGRRPKCSAAATGAGTPERAGRFPFAAPLLPGRSEGAQIDRPASAGSTFFLQLGEPPFEEAALGFLPGEGEGPPVRGQSLLLFSETPAEVGARRVREVVVVELAFPQ